MTAAQNRAAMPADDETDTAEDQRAAQARANLKKAREAKAAKKAAGADIRDREAELAAREAEIAAREARVIEAEQALYDNEFVGESLTPQAEEYRDPAPAEEDERLTRAQEARDFDQIHEPYVDAWSQPMNLEAPPPRPGYTQRWVTAVAGGEDDVQNLIRKQHPRYGWTPRRADTVPNGQAPSITKGQFAGCIGVMGMVLMERPIKVATAHRQAIDEKTRRQESATHAHVLKEQKAHQKNLRQTGERGIGAPEVEEYHSTVTRRRPVAPAPD